MLTPRHIFIGIALIATLVPAIFVLHKVGGFEGWHGVLPSGITDSLYYYARIHEVVDGYPLIGNPYIFEYRGTFSPAFFLPDVLSAVPIVIGLPFNIGILFNIFIWSSVFLILANRLLKTFGVSELWAAAWSIFLYLESYSFMLRPTIMQLVFPLFLLFLLALLQFLYEPFLKKRLLWLASVSALSFYVYNYLAFVVFLAFAGVFIWYLVSKQFKKLGAVFVAGLYTVLFLVPFGVYSFIQMQGSLYEETLVRIGLVYTHIPTIEAFYFGRWIVVGLLTIGALWLLRSTNERVNEKNIFWIVTGAALFVGLFLNVITGVELTLAVHVGRLVVLWMTLLLGAIVYEWFFVRKTTNGRYIVYLHLCIGVLVGLLLLGVVRNIPRALSFFTFDDRGYPIAELQDYAKPLAWLEQNLNEPVVILANISIGSYIPIMTKHYTLFHSGAILHSIPTEELEERYLLWRSFEDVTIDDVKQDFGLYSGAGPLKDQPRTQNNRAMFCNVLSRFIDWSECPKKTNGISLRGEEYFRKLAEEFKLVKVEQSDLLAKYHVRYLVVDTIYDAYNIQASTSLAVYADDRFLIFSVDDLER